MMCFPNGCFHFFNRNWRISPAPKSYQKKHETIAQIKRKPFTWNQSNTISKLVSDELLQITPQKFSQSRCMWIGNEANLFLRRMKVESICLLQNFASFGLLIANAFLSLSLFLSAAVLSFSISFSQRWLYCIAHALDTALIVFGGNFPSCEFNIEDFNFDFTSKVNQVTRRINFRCIRLHSDWRICNDKTCTAN